MLHEKRKYLHWDLRVHHKGMSYFPTNHYHGHHTCQPPLQKKFLWRTPQVPIDLKAIRKKFPTMTGISYSGERDLKALAYRSAGQRRKMWNFRLPESFRNAGLLFVMDARERKMEELTSTRIRLVWYKANLWKHGSDYTIKNLLSAIWYFSQTALKGCFTSCGKPLYVAERIEFALKSQRGLPERIYMIFMILQKVWLC